MPGALDGVRVIDFGQYVAGPLAAELLAQNGADVVHIDPPEGPRLAGLPDAYLNRGKQRIVLDLTREADRETARALCLRADVVVENFRPGVMDKLGLGAVELTESNPGLVYCSLPGFAAADPRSTLPAWEGVVLSATAGYRRLREHWDWKARANASLDDPGRPLLTALPLASNTAGILGALRMVTALYRRERTGRGAYLEVPLSEAMLEVIGFHLEFPDFVGPREDLPKAFLGSYRCSDGGFLDQVSYPRFVEGLLVAAGVWDSWCADGLGDMAKVFTDPVLKRVAERRFVDLVATRPAEYWERIVLELRSSAAEVRTPRSWLENDHARQSRTVVELEDPEFGRLTMAGAAMELSETPVVLGPRSRVDGDADAVRQLVAEPARTRVPITTADEPPLAGVRVLELSQVVAGPISGRLLADLGADVVKIANPAPDGNNGFHGSYTNRGKQTVYLDVQDREDFAAVRAAVDECDVVLQNYAYGAIERYGLGYDELCETRPDLVYVSMGAYARSGSWRARRGHENQAVAVTGLSSRYGGSGGWPMYQPYLICDVDTGIMGALGAVLGLFHRSRTGRGQHVSTSLTNVATLQQAIYLFDGGPDDARLPEPSGLDSRGWTALQRLYQASDGWLFLAAAPQQADDLREALALGAPRTEAGGHREDEELDGQIERVLGRQTRAHWTAVLAERGITAQPVRELDEVAHDPVWHRRGILRYARNGENRVSPVLGVGSSPWPVPDRILEHPGPLGAHTTHVRDRFRHVTSLEN
ncbi:MULTISPECIES: CaiB/BaiF CoA-transferase family protein [unclassified Rhodococcus (in: high G+C Gram-positive bacteria)]|uniref:CaiB/BaiF CoA-transferase family protein n=1 Tax=unclassified Rhodococcus (in: high G+C Gram-positive bacteria) TaxID=192944 RepID=UPI00092799C5|nr:CoA transferase [Rhodococcus sp. M8]OLL20918.1 acyl-CoA transferase/carnitine dehydratase [Rhodococcus sp. M8]QPG44765.1 CoA transferase [Rhodococcus sp. M8]